MSLRTFRLFLVFILASAAVARSAPLDLEPEEREGSLLRERRALLRNVVVQRKDASKAGRVTQEGLIDAFRALFLAELDLAPKPADRQALCDDFAREVKRRNDAIDGARKAGRLTDLEYTLAIATCREDDIRILRSRLPSPYDKEAAARLLALLRNRREAYQAVLLSMQDEVDAGRVSLPGGEQTVLAATVQAQLELADKPEDRARILQRHLDRLTQLEKVVETQFEVGRVPLADKLDARAAVLAAEIALARDKSTKGPAPEKLGELLREHRKVRQELVEARYKLYEAGKCTFATLLNTLEGRLQADLAAAEKSEDRIDALRTHLADVKKIEAAAKTRMEASFIPQADYETLSANRLEVEVRLLRAERSKK